MRTTCLILHSVILATALRAEDLTIPLDDGNLKLRVEFRNPEAPFRASWSALYPGSTAQMLTYAIQNQTSSRWKTVTLRFDIGALCGLNPQQWSVPVTIAPLGHADDYATAAGQQLVSSLNVVSRYGQETVLPIGKDVSRCAVEFIQATVSTAESAAGKFITGDDPTPDLSSRIESHHAQRIAEAARQERLESERKRREAEESARLAKLHAEEDARESARLEAKEFEERRKLRTACTAVYYRTIDKKVHDLTVREEQQVQACRTLGWYPPR